MLYLFIYLFAQAVTSFSSTAKGTFLKFLRKKDLYIFSSIPTFLMIVRSSTFDRQTDMDEALGSLKEKFERERSLLTEENRKLTSETDRVSGNKVSVCFLRGFWSALKH